MAVSDPQVIASFVANPDNTFLVSFPRTGSHWLRMIMELYFGRPSLVRVFYYPRRRDYLTLHTHDLELDVQRTHVIYLYRDPIDTIYSQLHYHREPMGQRDRIAYWTELYGRHLDKWLCRETFTQQKTVVRYERLMDNTAEEFSKICHHFGAPLQSIQLQQATAKVTKEDVKRKTPHDTQVVDLAPLYKEGRDRFRAEHGSFVWQTILDGRGHLQQHF